MSVSLKNKIFFIITEKEESFWEADLLESKISPTTGQRWGGAGDGARRIGQANPAAGGPRVARLRSCADGLFWVPPSAAWRAWGRLLLLGAITLVPWATPGNSVQMFVNSLHPRASEPLSNTSQQRVHANQYPWQGSQGRANGEVGVRGLPDTQ